MSTQDLSSLNGVTFTEAEKAGPKVPETYSSGVFTVGGAYTQSGPTTYTVTVLNNTYTPANGARVPTFGELKVVSSGVHGSAHYYSVIGFANDGFLTGGGSTDPSTPPPVITSGGGLLSTTEIFSNSASNFPLSFTQTNNFVAPCFAAGSRVRTLRGEVAVEALVVGDEVATVSGGLRPVIWIGSRRVRPASHPRPHELNPVRIRKGAFGEGQPVRDLLVSPGHAVFVAQENGGGVLIPAGHLVNAATIAQEAVDSVTYYHVELDAHDVLLAEGLACESYLEDGNRDAFANAPEHVALYGRLDPVDWDGACAPVVREGEALAAVQARLHARAEELGWTKTVAPVLTLEADGVALAPLHASGQRFWFAVPACAVLTARSPAAAPIEMVAGGLDTRRLGLAIGEVRVDGVALELGGEAFGSGFYSLEAHGDQAWRWTDGAATLALGLAAPAMVELTVLMVAPTWTRTPAPQLRLVHAG